VHMTVPGGAGALYSTTEDLLKRERGLLGGKVLSAASLQKMTTPFKSDYAFGLIARTVEGHKQIWHNGGINGFNTSLAYYPDTKIVVAVLSNVNGNAPDLMLPKLAAVAHGDAVQLTSERKEITVPPATLARYVGTYELAPRINMMVTLAGNQLMTQLSGQSKLPVFAETENKFFLKVVDAQLEFVKDGDKVTDVILHQNGRDQKAHRTSDTVLERKEITLSPQVLSNYAGTYEIVGLPNVVLTVEGGQLMFALGPQPKMQLFPESETAFFLKAVDAQMDFVKDPSGAVTQATLHMGPRDLKAQRK